MKKIIFVFFMIIGVFSLFADTSRMDVNNDGLLETVFYHPGKNYFYKIAFDFDKDGENDILLLIDENNGEYLYIDIDRNSWPKTINIGSDEWIKEKIEHAKMFWNKGGPQGSNVYDKNGVFVFTIPPNDQSKQSSICDVCNATVFRDSGYVLTGRDIMTNPDYIKGDSFMALISGLDPIQLQLSVLQQLFESGSIDTPWMLCNECFSEWKNLKN